MDSPDVCKYCGEKYTPDTTKVCSDCWSEIAMLSRLLFEAREELKVFKKALYGLSRRESRGESCWCDEDPAQWGMEGFEHDLSCYNARLAVKGRDDL